MKPVELEKYRTWTPQIIVEKLMCDEYPSEYDFHHFKFLMQWKSIIEIIDKEGIENNSIASFKKYLNERFSYKKEDGFIILL